MVVCPVDTPFVPPGLLRAAYRAVRHGALAALPHWEGRWHPLCGAYAPDVLPLLTTRLDAGQFDLHGLLENIAVWPLCGPALATVGILTFLGSWNNFLWPLVVATTEDKYTLPVALALYSVGQNQTRYGLLLAGSTTIILPVLVLFAFLQRHFVRGIATTGLK